MPEQESQNPEQEQNSKHERLWRRLGDYAVWENQLGDRLPHKGGITRRQALDEEFGPGNWRLNEAEFGDDNAFADIQKAAEDAEFQKGYLDRNQGYYADPKADRMRPGMKVARKGYLEVSDPVDSPDSDVKE